MRHVDVYHKVNGTATLVDDGAVGGVLVDDDAVGGVLVDDDAVH